MTNVLCIFMGGKTPSFFTYFIAKSQYGLCGLKPFPPLIWIPAYVSACIFTCQYAKQLAITFIF